MSSAWLTPAERASSPWQTACGEWKGCDRDDLLDHAALADEIIEELADRLRSKTHASDVFGCDCVPCVADRDLLKRVDALRNETG